MFVYRPIKKRTKRKPYIRSAYFKKEKVFLNLFWEHLFRKHEKDRIRRLKYFGGAIELIRYSHNQPASKENPNRRSEMLHRFAGLTKNKELFFIQIKENKKSGQKHLMSIFPAE